MRPDRKSMGRAQSASGEAELIPVKIENHAGPRPLSLLSLDCCTDNTARITDFVPHPGGLREERGVCVVVPAIRLGEENTSALEVQGAPSEGST